MIPKARKEEEGDTLIQGSGIFPEWFEQDTPLSFGPTLVPGGAVAVTFIPSDKGQEPVLDAAVRGRPIPCKAAVPGYRPGHLDTSRGDVSWNRYRPWIQGPAGRSQGFTGHDKAGIVRPMKYYAVATGRTTGIFTSWPEAKAQVEGFPGAVFKSFKTREQAQAFLADPVLGTGRKKTASSSSSRDNGPEGSDNDWPEGTIVVYTDGSAIGNPGPGGYGVVIREHPDAPAKELSGGFRHTTNNRMEMTAVIKALQALQGTDAPVVVHSDSRYVVDALTKGWARGWEKRGWKRSNGQPALNPDLWEQLLPLVRNLDVRFVWVRGHSGNPLNERCDELANTAARQQGDPDGMA